MTKYEALYGSTVVARAGTRWGIRRKAKRWCKSRDNRLRKPRLGNIRFYKFDDGELYRHEVRVKP